ncbi:MAG: nitrous oxide-stimulated promoter family protein [Pseudomonadota bacterium]
MNSGHENHRPVSLRKRDRPMSRKRLEREIKTDRIMIAMYCRHHHGGREICEDCRKLADYAVSFSFLCFENSDDLLSHKSTDDKTISYDCGILRAYMGRVSRNNSPVMRNRDLRKCEMGRKLTPLTTE